MRRILSWNVNGIRSIAKKGLLDWLHHESPDILCMQETKASPSQLSQDLLEPHGYQAYWSPAEKPGYSGVAVYTRERPLLVEPMGIPRFDAEGRFLLLEYADFTLITAYFPNSQDGGRRIDYKIDFCESMQALCDELDSAGRRFVLCGDYNIAHRPIDLARPRQNEQTAGYLPEERAWMDRFTAAGYVDTFRMYNSEGGHYTWWSYVTRGRERNVGWRIDYHCVNPAAAGLVAASGMLSHVMGSDHCPIEITLNTGEDR
jgi:exodeoxyribonuclease III